MVKKIVRHRSAVTGRFVKESYAMNHPDTTIKDTMKRNTKKKR